jgi:colicin import membrane protein
MKAAWTHRAGLLGMALLLGSTVRAQAPAGDAAQRERIGAERAAAERAYVQQVESCRQQFVVTSCIDEARARRHAVLVRLDREQQVLDESRRAQRASERLQAIDSKGSGEEARRREEAARKRSANQRGIEESRPAPAAASAAAPRTARAATSAVERAEQERRAKRAYDVKQVQAEAHRREVARRNEEHARKARPGAPLPTPAASAATPDTDERLR